MALGKQIQLYRKLAGWTLEQLAEKSGVEVGTISALEQRDSERSKFTGALAHAFGLSIDQLTDDAHTYPVPAAMQARPPGAQEAAPPPYGPAPWPFSTARHQFDALPEREKARVDGYIAATVQAWVIGKEAQAPA